MAHCSTTAGVAGVGRRRNQPPYNGAPKAPVLYVKPQNTLAAGGDPVLVPSGVLELEIGACLGLVIGRAACRLEELSALDYLAGYLIVNDVSIPHQPYYRPSIRSRARNGFCPIGPRVTPRAAVPDPDNLNIRVLIDGELNSRRLRRSWYPPVRKLLADVTVFITLSPGDVLAVGAAAPAPRVRSGQRARVEIDGLGRLENAFVQESV
jgi:5-oxopent-3-ene-1,2,5-tricarboxylate decarboxylase/2-hydroxyhepta-2,4-diene-1,7-dioate isomerase